MPGLDPDIHPLKELDRQARQWRNERHTEHKISEYFEELGQWLPRT
jgi:hypothetical protein